MAAGPPVTGQGDANPLPAGPRLYLGLAGEVPGVVAGRLTDAETLRLGGLRLGVDPATATLTATTGGGALHYWRLADATLKPLPEAPPPLTLARGDAYIAVASGGPGGESPALSRRIARFVHLRDYFNAQRLAEALLAHLAEAGEVTSVGVIVIEAR